jgi:cytochrome bd-type quinol oxidase subunit 2
MKKMLQQKAGEILLRPLLLPWVIVYAWLAVLLVLSYFVTQETSDLAETATVFSNNISLSYMWLLAISSIVLMYIIDLALVKTYKHITLVLVLTSSFMLVLYTLYLLPYLHQILL